MAVVAEPSVGDEMVMTGGVVSASVTVRDVFPGLPAASVPLKNTVRFPVAQPVVFQEKGVLDPEAADTLVGVIVPHGLVAEKAIGPFASVAVTLIGTVVPISAEDAAEADSVGGVVSIFQVSVFVLVTPDVVAVTVKVFVPCDSPEYDLLPVVPEPQLVEEPLSEQV